MPEYKLVNGALVAMTTEEVAAFRAEQAAWAEPVTQPGNEPPAPPEDDPPPEDNPV